MGFSTAGGWAAGSEGAAGSEREAGAAARPPVRPRQAWLLRPGREQTRVSRTRPVFSSAAPLPAPRAARPTGVMGPQVASGPRWDPPPVRLWEGRLTSQLVLLTRDRKPGTRPRPSVENSGTTAAAKAISLQGQWPGQQPALCLRLPCACASDSETPLLRSCRLGSARLQSGAVLRGWLCHCRRGPGPGLLRTAAA